MNKPSPYISVVTASRNDDHGGDPLIRTQIFINNFARQCEKYRLPAELIIVDWNPVPNRAGLAAVLTLPIESTFVHAYTITVPTTLHRRLKYADHLPLFQMIAKNVGIRRAKGEFVLATNIDILFSDELIRFIATQRLDMKKQYRVDRYDIESGLTAQSTLEETLNYAWSHPIRAHRRFQPDRLVSHLYEAEFFRRECIPGKSHRKYDNVEVIAEDGTWQVQPNRTVNMTHLHTNACGDFALLPNEGWSSIRGYPEFASYSFNIDSMGLIAAHYAGYQEISLLPPCVCFHIEHGIGSGWTPEGEKQLFGRLEKAGILNPEWPVLTPLVDEMRKEGRALEFNSPHWGLADIELPERLLGDAAPITELELEKVGSQTRTHSVSSIQPGFDLDRLTLSHERRHGPATYGHDSDRTVFYIPRWNGSYSEEQAVVNRISLLQENNTKFVLTEFPSRFRLRFDPCQCPGLVTIYSMTIMDKDKRLVWELTNHHVGKIKIAGTAVLLRDTSWRRRIFSNGSACSAPPLHIVSTGLDPQVLLPRLPGDVAFPIVISVKMNVAPSR